MTKGIFVTGVGTDVGKTFISGLLVKKLKEEGLNTGYYKPVLSGMTSKETSDVGYVKEIANLDTSFDEMVSFYYKASLSPHLASRIEGNFVDLELIRKDFANIGKKFDFIVVEGAGGIICPIKYEEDAKIFLEDIIKVLNLETILVTSSKLGSINETILSIEYLKSKNIKIKGIIVNMYEDSIMDNDNILMMEELSQVPILAKVEKSSKNIKEEIRRFL